MIFRSSPTNVVYYSPMKMTLLVIGAVALIVLALLFPLAMIWAVNVLFSLMIPFTFETYVASLVLMLLFGRTSQSKSSGD